MKAAQIKKYSKKINVTVRDIPIPTIKENEVLVKVKAAAVNPLDILNITGSVKLIQDYSMPLTIGNECSGIVEKVGTKVTGFQKGDFVYSRLPINKIGAFAEYAAIESHALAKMPQNYPFDIAAAIPLTGLTAYQGITEELKAKPNQTLLIPGGSGSFGQMAVPIAKALGLRVIVTGNERAKDSIISAGAEKYLNYKKEDYWNVLSEIDYVIDTLGAKEFEHELAVLKKGGRLLSLRNAPNKRFAEKNNFPFLKKQIFTLAGKKYDKAAELQSKEYRFMFVRSDGEQLKKITDIVEKKQILPKIDSRQFNLSEIEAALELVANGHTDGKVIIRF